MEFNEMVHATIAACFHVRLTGAFGERGRMAFLHATRCYAEQRGRRMAQRAIRDGVEVLDWGAYLRYGEWENTGDAKRLGCANQKEVLSLSPDYVIRITSCPWHARFAELGLTQAGRDYCRDLDRSIARGFNPDLVFELKCTLHDGPCCVQAMRGADFAPGQEHPPRNPGALRSFEYHCGHSYWTYRRIAGAVFGAEGRQAAERVLSDLAEYCGKETAERLLRFREIDFNLCN